MAKITATELIKKAELYVGYLEKKDGTSKYLTDTKMNFEANAGSANYTVFGDWYKSVAGIGNPNPWCAFFISYLFYKATGSLSDAKELLCGNVYAYCPTGVNQFKSKGRFYTSNPKVGDVIFFTNGSRAYHTGLIYKVDNSKVYTIEGNTSSSSGVVENGGCVAKKSYSLTYSKIMGYGRPSYIEATTTSSTFDNKEWIKKLQKQIGAGIDGIAGNETLSKTPTIKRETINVSVIKLIQEKLQALGYVNFKPNGKYGNAPYHDMYDAVIKYQKEVVGLSKPDGEFTSKGASWKKILGLK